MFQLSRRPWRQRLPALGGRVVVAALALAAAGCASKQAEYPPGYPQTVYAPQDVPAAPATPGQMASANGVVIEDDGLPSQMPPPHRRIGEPDDPREPYSPNYGGAAPNRQAASAAAPARDGMMPSVPGQTPATMPASVMPARVSMAPVMPSRLASLR